LSNAAILRWIGLILVVVLIALQLKLWVGGGGMAEVESLRASVGKQTEENAGLQKRNQALAADVEDLKHGEQATVIPRYAGAREGDIGHASTLMRGSMTP
jgi:cell division protein FtsB